MKVQDYLREHGLKKLQDELHIEVREYPDRIVLNYNQIESPRFHPVADECRALILYKNTWEVMARSFNRFYNVGEGEQWKSFPVSKSRIEEKVDGSIMSVYYDGEKWCVSTRSMAFAEGTIPLGLTFRQVFDKAVSKTSVWIALNELPNSKSTTWVFELTSPETRIVTPYPDASLTLIGARHNTSGNEISGQELDAIAKVMHVRRPRSYSFASLDEAKDFVKTLNSVEEGFVMTCEDANGFWRLKCKNDKYLAIAHMRENGNISPKRILTLIIANDQAEYLSYFPEDSKYFYFVAEIYGASLNRIKTLAANHMKIENQKEFALAIVPECKGYESGVLFQMRKTGKSPEEIIRNMGGKKVAESLNLRSAFSRKFGIEVEEKD